MYGDLSHETDMFVLSLLIVLLAEPDKVVGEEKAFVLTFNHKQRLKCFCIQRKNDLFGNLKSNIRGLLCGH